MKPKKQKGSIQKRESGKYQATIYKKGKRIYLGTFKTKTAAREAIDKKLS